MTVPQFDPAKTYTFPAANAYGNECIATGRLRGRNAPLDLIVGPTHGGEIGVLLGKTDGTFADAVAYPTGFGVFGVRSLVVGDFNGDGRLDVAVCNPNGLSVLLGNGDGTFAPPAVVSSSPFIHRIAVGDFDGDGKDEIAVTGFLSVGVYRLLPTGFQQVWNHAWSTPTSTIIGAIVAGNFGGHDTLDLAVQVGVATIQVLRGNGDGTFQLGSAVALDTSIIGYGNMAGMAAGHFRGAGQPLDLVVAGVKLALLLGDGHGSFTLDARFWQWGALIPAPGGMVAADFNGDGKVDLAETNWANDNLLVLPSLGDGSFESSPAGNLQVNLVSGAVPKALVAGDFDGDGRMDLAIATCTGVSVLKNTTPLLCSAVHLTASPASGVNHGEVDLTAVATSSGVPEFQFSVQASGEAVFTLLRSWHARPVLTWWPNRVGTHQLRVEARAVGTQPAHPAQDVISYRVRGAVIEVTPPSPQPPGYPVWFYATKSDWDNPEYQFSVFPPPTPAHPTGGPWTNVQNWSTADTCYWDTQGLAAGHYDVKVEVRDAHNPAAAGSSAQVSYRLGPIVLIDNGYPPSPQKAGTEVKFTATARGLANPEYSFILYSCPPTGPRQKLYPWRSYSADRTFLVNGLLQFVSSKPIIGPDGTVHQVGIGKSFRMNYPAGVYQVEVLARHQGSLAASECSADSALYTFT